MPITDVCWFENNLDYICTNVQDIFISTESYIGRGGQLRNKDAYKSLIRNDAQSPYAPQDI